MLSFTTGNNNIFDSDAEALVCPVNCWGIAGAGLAKDFRARFPRNYESYRAACLARQLGPGDVLAVRHSSRKPTPLRYIINLATKDDWRSQSSLPTIEKGLTSLRENIQHLALRTVAVPALGCGCGGLRWCDVRALFRETFDDFPDAEVIVYEPKETSDGR